MKQQNDDASVIFAGICFILVFLLGIIAVSYSLGRMQKRPSEPRGQALMQGEPPFNTPVLLYWVRQDGTIYAESALKTDYAGLLPFSVKAQAVPFEVYGGWDYWEPLDASFAGGQL